jgi:hypothetical protein
MSAATRRRKPLFPIEAPPVVATSPATPGQPVEAPRSTKAKTRVDKRQISVPVDPEVHQQLRLLAVREGKTVEGLGREALDLLFRARGLSRIAAAA